jgi:multicomponent Na+:H+ antiporter subunit D
MMFAIAPNPGFPLLAAGLLMLALPAALRAPTMALGAIGALWMLFAPAFGASHAFEQLGVVIVAVRMDALAQVFGLGLALTALICALSAPVARNRQEDAALGLHIGGALTATFAGDLVSFLAASELSALAGGWLIIATQRQTGLSAGMRYLMWHAPASILLLAGCAFQLAMSSSSAFEATSVASVGGTLLALGFLVRVGAFLAHPWGKDAAAAVSSSVLGAMVITGPLLALYALSRAFPGEAFLAYAGLGMIGVGALFAFVESDLRRAFAALMGAQFGAALVVLAAPDGIGVTASAALALSFTLGGIAMAAGLGALVAQAGSADARKLWVRAGAMPLSVVAVLAGGLSLAGMPALAGGMAVALTLPALAATVGPWAGLSAAVFAGLTACCVFRIVAAGFFAPLRAATPGAARQPTPRTGPIIGLLLSVFLCLAVGVAPAWLESLAPTPARLNVGAAGLLDQALAIAAAGVVLALGTLLRLVRLAGVGHPRDIDAFYEGPLFSFGRWFGVLLLRMFGALGALAARLGQIGAGLGAGIAAFADRPHRPGGPGLAAVAGVTAAVLFLVFVLL